jgi:glycerate-2-kinase
LSVEEDEKARQNEKKAIENEKRRLAAIAKPVHAWVCVNRGKRGVKDTVFVESTTGEVNKVSDIIKYIKREKEKEDEREVFDSFFFLFLFL